MLIPATRTYFPRPRTLAAAEAAGCPDSEIASVSYREPSLVFLGGTDVELTDAAGAARFLREGDCRVAIVDRATSAPSPWRPRRSACATGC